MKKNEPVTNCARFKSLEHSTNNPYAFTGHGAIMIATVLNSAQADKMSVFVVRVFVKLRVIVSSEADNVKHPDELEKKAAGHDKIIKQVVDAISQLVTPE